MRPVNIGGSNKGNIATSSGSNNNRNGGSNSKDFSYSSLRTGEFDDDELDMDNDIRMGNKDRSQVYDYRMKQQNESLSMLESSVLRLGQLSLNISQEIDDQNRMLTKLDEDTEIAQNRSNVLLKATNYLIKRSGGPKICCTIVGLSLVLIVLILLVIYT
jgi:hypothetical protein